MSAVIRQFRDFWPLLSALLMLALPDVAFAQQTRSQQAPPSILIGGYRVALGMTVEQVNKLLGSVFSASMEDPKTWIYRQGDQVVAVVYHENGRVFQIIKEFKAALDERPVTDRMIKGHKYAVEEFLELTRGLQCSRLRGAERADGEGYVVELQCGPYMLQKELWKFSEGDLALSSRIYVLR